MSRAAQLDCQHLRSCALVLTLFLFQKGQGFFPPLPIAALPRRSRRGAYLPLAGWDASLWLENFGSADKRAGILIHSWWGHTQPLQGGMIRRELYIFSTQKASGISNPRWPF